MDSLFGILIWTSLLVSMNGQVLFDDMGDTQRSLHLALHFMKTELQQFKGVLMKKLESIENIIEVKMDQQNKSLSTIQTEQRLLRQEMRVSGYPEMNGLLKDNAGLDCANILDYYPDNKGRDGVYYIMDSTKARAVYCDMTTDNGGWTVIHRRVNGSVDFYRNWTEYKNGFGFADHEYWIGNDMLHKLSSMKPQELRVDMERFNGEKAYALYSRFYVGDEASKYQLQVNGYSGNAGDGLDYNNNMKFTTWDQDNDRNSSNCAIDWRSAGWFNNCLQTNFNGQYMPNEISGNKYMHWYFWIRSPISLKTMQLMIRPQALHQDLSF